MGRHITQGIDAIDQPINAYAQEAIAAGDLVKVDSAGWVAKVSDALPLASQNTALGPTVAYASAIVQGSYYGYGTAGYMQSIRCLQPLPDGGYAIAYSGNGSSMSIGANLAIYTAANVRRVTLVLSAGASNYNMRVVRAGADNVLVAWAEGTALMIAVVNFTTGAVVLAASTVGTTTNDQASRQWHLATLASGEVVLAYRSGANMVFKRFSATGALQGAETVVESAQDPNYVTVLPQSAGGFIVRWAKTNVTQGNRMARYSAAGVLQGAVVQISSGASAYDGAGTSSYCGALEGKLIELASGNIVSTDISTDLIQGFRVYDSTLALLNTVSLGASSANLQDCIQLAAKSGGGFWVTSYGVARLQEYSNAGALLRTGGTGFSATGRIIDRPGNGPVVINMSHVPGTPSSSLAMYAIDSSLAYESGSALYVHNASSLELSSFCMERLSNGLIQIAYTPYSGSGGIYVVAVFPGAASVLGVAQNAAAIGQPVRVATAGKHAINQAISAAPFDRRSSSPIGTKGAVIGGTAVLNGINGG